MSVTLERSLRCTLHWLENNQPCQQDVILPDRAIGELVSALVESLGLADDLDDSSVAMLGLRRRPGARALSPIVTLSDTGISDGDHLWLTSEPKAAATPPRFVTQEPVQQYICDLILPDGTTIALGPEGQIIDRRWLLDRLRRPEQLREQLRYHLRWRRKGPASPYQAVSTSAHCQLSSRPDGTWVVTTTRTDVQTWLNGVPLVPDRPTPLADQAQIQPGGPDGPVLVVRLSPHPRPAHP